MKVQQDGEVWLLLVQWAEENSSPWILPNASVSSEPAELCSYGQFSYLSMLFAVKEQGRISAPSRAVSH